MLLRSSQRSFDALVFKVSPRKLLFENHKKTDYCYLDFL